MRLKILKPGEVLLESEVRQVTLPGVGGQSTPMEGHDRMIAVLKGGRVTYSRADRPESSREGIDIVGGVAEVLPYAVTIFVNES